MSKGQPCKSKTVEEIIDEELGKRILLAKKKVERLNKDLYYANKLITTLEEQRKCLHVEWENLGGHIRIESRCKKCGLIHMA